MSLLKQQRSRFAASTLLLVTVTFLSALTLLATMLDTTFAQAGAAELDALEPGQRIADFELEAVYENEVGQAIGARFRHDPTRFVLDILRIQSLPQAFTWVNSPPPSDQGEPHTLEHLLLGKGTKGRYVASLEEVSLGISSAFTEQRRTCYHFSTSAGTDVFFQLFEAKLDAMLNPNFTDEEIRREVCNMGVVEDQDTGALGLEEKGTVYSEMVRAYESPWGNLYNGLLHTIYGKGHPLSLESGGLPAAIREMQPGDVRRFHAETHHLNNMGTVVSIGDEIALDDCLTQLSGILARVEPGASAGDDPAAFVDQIPAAGPAPAGTTLHTRFPHQNENEPGLLVFAWPARSLPQLEELFLYELFMDLLAAGETSNLYRIFIDSQTQRMDIGASAVFSWVENEPGHPAFVGLQNVTPEHLGDDSIQAIRALIQGEIRTIADLTDGSEELARFNERAGNLIKQWRRDLRDFLNSPPRFGYRGTGHNWIDLLQQLHAKGGHRRNLAMIDEMGFAENLLATNRNFWREYLAKWRLLDTPPYAAAATADPSLLASSEAAREQRIADFTASLREEHGAETDDASIRRYQEDYDRATAVLDSAAATIEMPPFIDKPPMGLDDPLRYATGELPGGGQLVTSTFDNITRTTVGLALRMNSLPDTLLMYVPALPTLLTEIGVVRDGEPIAYDTFIEALRREVLELDAYYDVNYRTERVELMLRAAGGDPVESERAFDWLNVALFHPDLRAANLPRIRDAVDTRLSSLRNRMRGREESWVRNPASAYWKQQNPLLLEAASFLTQTHSMHRLRWRVLDGGDSTDEFEQFMIALAAAAETRDRAQLAQLLETLAQDAPEAASGAASGAAPGRAAGAATETAGEAPRDLPQPLAAHHAALSPRGAELVREAARDLTMSLSDLPDASLIADIGYLCRQMTADLAVPPATALTHIETALDLLRHQDNARAFLVANPTDQEFAVPAIEAIVRSLDPDASVHHDHRLATPLIAGRLAGRSTLTEPPLFVGLVNQNTRSGVHVHSADCASFKDTDEEKLLRFLAARLYGGGGAHSMFMKTWGAGLAYSNGLRSNENSGRLSYYAERCPDLTQTMQFVVNELKSAPHDPALAEYAVAQAFNSRSGARYEERGEAMAANLADGQTPAVVASFRKGILTLRTRENLYNELHQRMLETYGEVLPGYGPPGRKAAAEANALYFVIGPDEQLESWESYLRSVEGEAVLHRLYPRDFWNPLPEVTPDAEVRGMTP